MESRGPALCLLLLVGCSGLPDAPRGSHGCGIVSPVPTGVTTPRTIQVNGLTRSYRLRVPASYSPARPMPLVLSHHGWTCSATEDERDSGLGVKAESAGFIVAFLNGYDDNDHQMIGGWKSWNGAGTVYSNSSRPGCLAWGGTKEYCYQSCHRREDARHDGGLFSGCDRTGCDWTTCVSSDEFNTVLLDTLETELCVDVTREYATGQSNGAIYTFHLGATMSSRLAAIAPISGSMMHGYIRAPSQPMPVLDCTGTLDRTVPINDTSFGNGAVSNEGWVYETMARIFAAWEPANGCTGSEKVVHWPTSLDGRDKLFCWGRRCSGAPAVRCAWDGARRASGGPMCVGRRA